jgi:hypothetical protein
MGFGNGEKTQTIFSKLRKEHSMIMRLDLLRASSQNSGNIGKLLQDVESWFRFVAIYA